MTPAATNVFLPDKKRRKREGYADGDYTLFKPAPASEFIYSRSVDPVTFLGSYNKIDFVTEDEKSWRDGPLMTEELRQCCEDLKVLGKRDFKALLKWRLLLREEVGSILLRYIFLVDITYIARSWAAEQTHRRIHRDC